jgi:hypothetical protein
VSKADTGLGFCTSSHMMASMHVLRGCPISGASDNILRAGSIGVKALLYPVVACVSSSSSKILTWSSRSFNSCRRNVFEDFGKYKGSVLCSLKLSDKFSPVVRLFELARHSMTVCVSIPRAPRRQPMSFQYDPFFFGQPLQGFSGSHYRN